MKEAIGGSWLFVFVIIFIALFSGFICLAVNYSRCYKTKDDILNIIEKNRGVTEKTIDLINEKLNNIGYRKFGKCPEGPQCWYAYNIESTTYSTVGYSNKINYCIAKTDITNVTNSDDRYSTTGVLGHPNTAYYSVALFFGIDIPVLWETFQISMVGETAPITGINVSEELSYYNDGSTGHCVK